MKCQNRYPDCESCAFSEEENHPICDECDDGDQWEPIDSSEDYDENDFSGAYYANSSIRLEKPKKTKFKIKKAA